MTTLYVGAGLLALALLTAVLVLGSSSTGPTGVAKSLALIDQEATDRTVQRTQLPARDRLIDPLFERTTRLAYVLTPKGASDKLAQMLDRAGNPRGWSVERIMGGKGMLLLIGAVLGFLYAGLTVRGFLVAVLAAVVAFHLPDLLLYNAALRRQEAMAHGLAEALDLLTVCVEAGQGFDAALMQVARNVEGPISGEFTRVLSEIQLGLGRGASFSAMGDRVRLPEVKNFTSALVQADRLGLPIASVLREQTATMRLVRRQRAEEKAQKVGVKVLFPLVLCIFPVMFVVLLGPGVMRMVETFSSL